MYNTYRKESNMKKTTFEEAFEIMINLHKVFEEVNKKHFDHIEAGSLRFLLMSEKFLKQELKGEALTIKAMKEIIISKHNIKDKKEICRFDVKLSKTFKSLATQGYVELVPSKADARIKEIQITKAGQKCIDDYTAFAKQKWEELNNV